MKKQEVNNIRLIVKDEQDLYTPLSPDDEFSDPVKSYIRSKALNADYKQPVKLTVISSSPLDEEKFRSAAANWVREEKTAFELNAKQSTKLPTAMFIIGGLVVIIVSLLKQHFEPLTYAIILIIGTAVIGKGVTNWYEHVPAIRARRWLTEEVEKKSTIVFEYENSDLQKGSHL